jgi:uncharacterized protein YyaL (SSP411 family)
MNYTEAVQHQIEILELLNDPKPIKFPNSFVRFELTDKESYYNCVSLSAGNNTIEGTYVKLRPVEWQNLSTEETAKVCRRFDECLIEPYRGRTIIKKGMSIEEITKIINSLKK